MIPALIMQLLSGIESFKHKTKTCAYLKMPFFQCTKAAQTHGRLYCIVTGAYIMIKFYCSIEHLECTKMVILCFSQHLIWYNYMYDITGEI